MKATKEWGPCACNCGKNIGGGKEFVMVDGAMYLLGHEERRTRQIPVVKPMAKTLSKKGKGKKTGKKDFTDLPLFGAR